LLNEQGQKDSKKSPPQQLGSDIFNYRSQKMDYFTVDGVNLRTGYTNKLDWYLLPIRELLDNACDFLQKHYKGTLDATISVTIHMSDGLFHLTVRNSNKDDKPVFSTLGPIFNFRYGSKQDVHVISRGMLGDALKQILSLGYVLQHSNDDESNFTDKQWNHPLIIRHNKQEISVSLEVDNARQEAIATIKSNSSNNLTDTGTELELVLPVIDEVRNDLTRDYIEKYCLRYALLSTDISFNFKIIDDITHYKTSRNDNFNLKEVLTEAISTVPEKGILNIDIPALHPIASEWKNTDSVYSYKPEEFKRRILNVHDPKIPVYDVLRKFREGSNIQKKQYQITVEELLKKPEKKRNKIIEQYFNELHHIMSPPELSLPYPAKFATTKGNSRKRYDVLIQRIAKTRPDIDTTKNISYKLVKGIVTDAHYLKYPFAFEILAVPLKDPVGSSGRSSDVKQHEFLGAVNYSFSPRNNYFDGEYRNTFGYVFASDIKGVLEHYGFWSRGDNFNKLPCIIIGNLITPKWAPTSHDKSGVNMKPFSKVVILAIERLSKDIQTYRAAGIHWHSVGSKNEYVDITTHSSRGRISAYGLVEEFLIKERGLPT
jgi:hypothetical protein